MVGSLVSLDPKDPETCTSAEGRQGDLEDKVIPLTTRSATDGGYLLVISARPRLQ